MSRLLVGALGVAALSCNSVLGISDTSLRDEGGAGKPSAAGGAAACSTHADCLSRSNQFEPSVCISERCVTLLTPECPLVLPQTEMRWLSNLQKSGPEPLILGAFAPVPTALLSTQSRNYDLVLTEVSRSTGGLPTPSGQRRPVIAVVCRTVQESSAALDRATDHLIDELRVPGLLAGLYPSDLEYVFRRKGLANHVFFMSPLDADRSLVDLIDDGLIWHMLSGGEQLAPTYPPLLNRTLRHLRNTGRLGEDEPARVALVTAGDVRTFVALSGALTGGLLQINGRPARQNSADYFREISITSGDLAQEPPDYSDAILALKELAPHVVIAVATDEFVSIILPALEAPGATSEPFYLLSPWHYNNDHLILFLKQHRDLVARVVGVNYAAAEDSTVYDGYQARFDAAYPAFAGTRGYENFYDAAYYLLYSAAAAEPRTPLLGSDLKQGMRRLLAGSTNFDVGPDDLGPAFTTLETLGSSIRLNGAMGPPNFEPRTGVREEPGSVWCVDEGYRYHADVLRLDAASNLVGTFPCFDFGEP